MATIYKDYGSGGSGFISKAGTSGGSGSKRHPAIADVLRDIADDLAAINNAVAGTNITSADPAAISEGALAAFTDPPTAGEMAALRALVNELRTTVIALRTLALEVKTDVSAATGGVLKTIKG